MYVFFTLDTVLFVSAQACYHLENVSDLSSSKVEDRMKGYYPKFVVTMNSRTTESY